MFGCKIPLNGNLSFTHSHVIPNLYWNFFCGTQKEIFWTKSCVFLSN